MSAATVACNVEESGWPSAARVDHLQRGKELVAELRRWSAAENSGARDFGPVEELGAVLEGRFELISGEDRYELGAGQAALVPAAAPRRWRALEGGTLYRVACLTSADT